MIGNNANLTRMYDLCHEIADCYRRELINENAVAGGALSDFKYEVEYDEGGFSLYYDLPEYWYYIEEGRGPTLKSNGGRVVPAIRRWIEQKGITPIPRGGRTVTKDSLAYAIAKKIHERGYFDPNHHGKHPLEHSLTKSEDLQNELGEEFAKALTYELENDISQL